MCEFDVKNQPRGHSAGQGSDAGLVRIRLTALRAVHSEQASNLRPAAQEARSRRGGCPRGLQAVRGTGSRLFAALTCMETADHYLRMLDEALARLSEDVRALATWNPAVTSTNEVSFMPARVHSRAAHGAPPALSRQDCGLSRAAPHGTGTFTGGRDSHYQRKGQPSCS